MTDFVAARSQMAVSLGFHIIFAVIGMVMPFFMMASHFLFLKRKERIYLELTRAWSKGVAVFFAVGAVSGTILSFELGLLWPKFMEMAGPVIGLPFGLEGAAFFLEAIALGLFLYGWDRLNPWLHWFCGALVGLCGLASGIFVVAVNAWMNSPSSMTDPVAAMFNPAWFDEALHMTLAAFIATGFAVAGLHAFLLLKNPKHPLHRKALKIALAFTILPTLLQPLSGDLSAKGVAKRQPLKLAAMEAHFNTEAGAPLLIGGIPDVENEITRGAIALPKMLSFLAYGNTTAEVKGLKDFDKSLWPPVLVTHVAFQIMVATGSFLCLVSLITGMILVLPKFKKFLFHKNFLILIALCTPLGMLALEAGWTVTEVGRQPWVIYNILKSRDALTPVTGLALHFWIFTGIYLVLTALLCGVMRRQIQSVREVSDD